MWSAESSPLQRGPIRIVKLKSTQSVKVNKRSSDKRVVAPKSSAPNTFTPEKRALFCETYAGGSTVHQAAKVAGVSATVVFYHRRINPDFTKQYEDAQDANTNFLEAHLLRHALESGVPGNITALFGLLRARRPAVWRENHRVEVSGKVEHSFPAAFAAAMNSELDIGGGSATQTH